MFNGTPTPVMEYIIALLIGLLGGLVRQLYQKSTLVTIGSIVVGLLASAFVGSITYLLLLDSGVPSHYVIALVGISGWGTGEVLKLYTILLVDKLRLLLGVYNTSNDHTTYGRRADDLHIRTKDDIEKLQASMLSDKITKDLRDNVRNVKGDD